MSIQWVTSATALPVEGDRVEFHVEYREIPLAGTFVGNAFRTRWSDYDRGRVRSWRVADGAGPLQA